MMIIKNMWFIMRFQKSKMEYFTKNVIASKKELDLCSDEEQHQKNQQGARKHKKQVQGTSLFSIYYVLFQVPVCMTRQI